MKSKIPHATAQLHAANLVERLAGRVAIGGSIRREDLWVGDIDLLVEVPTIELCCNWACNILADLDIEVLEGSRRRATGVYEGIQVNIWTCLEEEWAAALFYVTGPKQYNVAYRARAKRMGLRLNEKGLWKGDERIRCDTEADIYRALDKVYREPVLRGKRPIDPVERINAEA